MDAQVVLAGEEFRLMPERAAYWVASKTLFVADVHFGKSAAMRAASLPVPGGTTSATLARLSLAVERSGAQRLIILGDLWHAKDGRQPSTLAVSAKWRAEHASLEVMLVEGNHDRRSGALPEEFQCTVVEEPFAMGPFSLCHDPAVECDGYQLSGHIHPCAILEGRGRLAERFPCFWVTPGGMVLPPFGEFTGCVAVRPRERDRVFIVSGDQVIEPRCVTV